MSLPKPGIFEECDDGSSLGKHAWVPIEGETVRVCVHCGQRDETADAREGGELMGEFESLQGLPFKVGLSVMKRTNGTLTRTGYVMTTLADGELIAVAAEPDGEGGFREAGPVRTAPAQPDPEPAKR